MPNHIESPPVTPRPAARYRVARRVAPTAPAVVRAGAVTVYEPVTPMHRDYKKIAGAVIFAVLIALIFFSRTIYSYNLPVITAVKPENGRLSKLETSSGVVGWAETQNIYAAVVGKAEELLVKEGDAVTAGQELIRLSFDRDEAERKLRELQNSRAKLQNDIKGIELRIEKQNRYMDELLDEDYGEDEISDYDLKALELDIERAELDLWAARDKYQDGRADDAENLSDLSLAVDKAQIALSALHLKREETERKLEEQRENALSTLEEKEAARWSKLADYEAELESLQLDLAAKSLDLNGISLQEEPYRKALEQFDEHTVLTAPIDGTIISLEVGLGEAIREDQLIASIGAAGSFELECSIPLDNNFVLPGDNVELSNSVHMIYGTVTGITPTAQGKTVTIVPEPSDITSGETFDVTFRKRGDATYVTVPNGAVNRDNDGYFLNQVKKRDGLLGEEYYLSRLDVYIGDSDDSNTVITQGITFFEPVMLTSDKTVASGDVVLLSNAGDFFEK